MTLRSDPKKDLFLRNMDFLCDAIDLKQSVKNTLKVWGKYLTSVLDELQFIVNLYSFFLPLVLHASPSLAKVSNLPFPDRAASKNSPFYLCKSLFLEYISTLRLESTKW